MKRPIPAPRAGLPAALLLAAAPLLVAGCAGSLVRPIHRPHTVEEGREADVPATELARGLGLEARWQNGGRTLALTDRSGRKMLLYAGTRVASVHGETYRAVGILEARSGDVWLTRDDASALRHLRSWASSLDSRPSAASARRPPPPPRPRRWSSAPSRPRSVAGNVADRPTWAERAAWTVPLRRDWRYIVVHHSASSAGSARTFHQAHRKRGWDGLGYDFVIGNGNGSPDGRVEVGYRWREQKVGAHAGVDYMNQHGVGICLVGNFDLDAPTHAQIRALTRLCNFLGEYCGIPPENLRLHRDLKTTACPGRHFPRDFTFAGLGELAFGGGRGGSLSRAP